MKRKRKKGSNQDKAGELNKSFPKLGVHPASFLNIWLCLFGIVDSLEPNIHRTWRNLTWKMAELLNFWPFHLYLSDVLQGTPSLVLFIVTC